LKERKQIQDFKCSLKFKIEKKYFDTIVFIFGKLKDNRVVPFFSKKEKYFSFDFA